MFCLHVLAQSLSVLSLHDKSLHVDRVLVKPHICLPFEFGGWCGSTARSVVILLVSSWFFSRFRNEFSYTARGVLSKDDHKARWVSRHILSIPQTVFLVISYAKARWVNRHIFSYPQPVFSVISHAKARGSVDTFLFYPQTVFVVISYAKSRGSVDTFLSYPQTVFVVISYALR